MKIYVDFDDCLCETAREFSELVMRMFGKNVPYEKIPFFDLKESFQLTDSEHEQLMIEGHRQEVLLSYEESPGASRVLNEWMDQGHEVFVITGRPVSTFDASHRWLDEHDLKRARLFFLNKYGRDNFGIDDSGYNLELEDYYQMRFDIAIEDSPEAFRFFDHLHDLKVMVYDRPWNRNCQFPDNRYFRCEGWDRIQEMMNEFTLEESMEEKK